MRHLLCAFVLLSTPALAETTKLTDIVDGHVIPRFEALAETSHTLAETAATDCIPTSVLLRDAYGTAFDAWVSASHLRFGPTEVDDRAFALAFWPDSRGATPRSLSALIAGEDPIAASPIGYAEVSIAARGFYALEFLLYDETLMEAGSADYHCQLVQTVTADIAMTSEAILDDWTGGFRDQMLSPSSERRYRTEDEALQELFKALATGLQFTSETRLGRPLGTFDRPRPTRSEARRSGRSAQHVMLSLTSLRDLAARLSGEDAGLNESLTADFDAALSRLSVLDDTTFAGVAEPQSRLRIEVIQQAVETIRATVTQELGPTLGVSAGFNSLDGD